MPFVDKTEQEIEDVKRYVSMNPYYSYDDMVKRLLTNKDMPMELFAEYGMMNHECLKTIYENIWDETICREMGQKIYDCGGHKAMVMNFYSLMYSPLRESENRMIRGYYRMVEHWWDKIGEWRH
jgi:hypothetical protein